MSEYMNCLEIVAEVEKCKAGIYILYEKFTLNLRKRAATSHLALQFLSGDSVIVLRATVMRKCLGNQMD